MDLETSRALILVVEDDFWAAQELKSRVESLGYTVLGPVPAVDNALDILEKEDDIAGAILDVNLGNEMVFPVADALARRAVPFIFATAYEPDFIPRRHQSRQLVRKPLDTETIDVALKDARQTKRAVGFDLAQNALLSRLSLQEKEEIAPFLEKLTLSRGALLEQPGFKISHAYFPLSCIASVIIRGGAGDTIETGIIGREGMTAFEMHSRDNVSTFEIVNQIEGEALKIRFEYLESFHERSSTFAALTACFARVLNIQTSYTALANTRFSVLQRLARWLVMIHDRIGTSTFTITHEYLSVMLGVRRATITEALHVLEGNRLIKSTRGVVRIINRDELIAATGGSYGVPEAEYRRLFDKGQEVAPGFKAHMMQ